MTKRNHTSLARGFLDALVSNKTEALRSLIHRDVDWVIYGPIDMFPFLGSHRGRDAVLSACDELLAAMNVKAVSVERQVVDADSASLLMRCTLRPIRIDHAIIVRIAAFVQIRDNLIGDVRVVVDTFDLVEQSLGREINLPMVS